MTTTRTLRVAMVALHFAEYASCLCRALARNCQVLLVLYRDNAEDELAGRWRETLESAGIDVVLLARPRSARQIWRNAHELLAAFRRFAPDVVHVQEALRDEIFVALLRMPTLDVVLTVHDPNPHSGADAASLRFSRRGFYRWYLRRRAGRLITHGQALVDALKQLLPAHDGRVHSVVHGPLGQAAGGGQPSGAAVAGGPARLLFFGRINRYKGLGHFVEAVISLKERGLNVLGVVAGSGDDLAHHRERMRVAGCFDVRDRYIPALETHELFSAATIVVLPYIDGTQSGVAAIALGYGKPVIATNVGAIPEMVRDGVNGLIVEPGDLPALTDAIERVIRSPSLIARFSNGALTLRDGDLSWRSAAEATEVVYRQLAGEAERPPPARGASPAGSER